MAKPNNIVIAPVKLSKQQKKIMVDYLTQQIGVRVAATRLGMTPTKLYGITNAMMRHSAKSGIIDAETFLSNY